MSWAEFEEQVKAAGLKPINRNQGHWQIKGGAFTVNYYPSRRTIYVNGTHSKRSTQAKGTYKEAIAVARRVPNTQA